MIDATDAFSPFILLIHLNVVMQLENEVRGR
jgi:hypothetical protein